MNAKEIELKYGPILPSKPERVGINHEVVGCIPYSLGSIYEIASGQSFTQRVLIPKAIKLYKEKSYLYKGINRYVQWKEHSFLG